jgi:hypothetical protein
VELWTGLTLCVIFRTHAPKSPITTKLEQPVQLVTERESSHPLQFGYPSPTIYAGIYAGATRVGSIEYGLNPILDRVYVHKIDIDDQYRANGHGMATLKLLHDQHHVPIVPVHIWGSALGFWSKAKSALARSGGSISAEIRGEDEDGCGNSTVGAPAEREALDPVDTSTPNRRRRMR